MALITLMSAKGAPGTTTTSMLLATLWPRPTILVDADPLGGDIALRLVREDGRPLDRERGLLSLLPVARRGLLPGMVHQHTQTALGGQPVVTGLAGPEQASAVGPLWTTLADAFAAVPDADVVVDAGQVDLRAGHFPLVSRADVVLWVYRPTAWSVLHTRRRLEALASTYSDSPATVGVVAVARPDQKHDVESAAAALAGEWTWLTDFGSVALDPKAVVMFEGGEIFRPERSLLARSGRAFADGVAAATRYTLAEGSAADVAEEDPAHEPGADTEDLVDAGEPKGRGRRKGRRRA